MLIPRIVLKDNSWQDDHHDQFNHLLVGGLEHGFYFSIQLGISSSQLVRSHVFQRGGSTTKQFGYDSHDSPQPMDRSRGIHFRNGDSTAESGCHRRNLGGTIFGLLGVWVNTLQNRCFMGYHPGIFSSVILINHNGYHNRYHNRYCGWKKSCTS